jgi:hypothetical protein
VSIRVRLAVDRGPGLGRIGHAEKADDPTIENPVNTGHTFRADNLNACSEMPGCHPSPEEAEEDVEEIEADFNDCVALIEPYLDDTDPAYIDRGSLSASDRDRYDIALFDFRFATGGGCKGVHNPEYVFALLDIAKDIFDDLSPAP